MFSRKKPPTEPAWCVAQVVNEEEDVTGIVRFIEQPTSDSKRLKTAVEIAWKYAAEGLPTPEQNEEMNEFERAIDPLTEDRGNAQMVYVRTAFGVKEWLLYVRDADAFMRAFNERLGGRSRDPIEVRFYADPKWQLWREFVQPLSERAKWEDAN